jgi:hypothetical protein
MNKGGNATDSEHEELWSPTKGDEGTFREGIFVDIVEGISKSTGDPYTILVFEDVSKKYTDDDGKEHYNIWKIFKSIVLEDVEKIDFGSLVKLTFKATPPGKRYKNFDIEYDPDGRDSDELKGNKKSSSSSSSYDDEINMADEQSITWIKEIEKELKKNDIAFDKSDIKSYNKIISSYACKNMELWDLSPDDLKRIRAQLAHK